MPPRDVLGVEQLDDRPPRFRTGSKRINHVSQLVLAALAKKPSPVSPIDCLPVLSLFLVSRDIIPNELELISPCQIPQELTEAAKGLSARLGSTETSTRVLKLKENTNDFSRMASRG
jgi:hypothetical protein